MAGMRMSLTSIRRSKSYMSLAYEPSGAPRDEFLSEADEKRAREITDGTPSEELDTFLDYILTNYPNWEPILDADGLRIGVQHHSAGWL